MSQSTLPEAQQIHRHIQQQEHQTVSVQAAKQTMKTSGSSFFDHFSPSKIKKKLKGFHFPSSVFHFKKDNVKPKQDLNSDLHVSERKKSLSPNTNINISQSTAINYGTTQMVNGRQSFLSNKEYDERMQSLQKQKSQGLEFSKPLLLKALPGLQKSQAVLTNYAQKNDTDPNSDLLTRICNKIAILDLLKDNIWQDRLYSPNAYSYSQYSTTDDLYLQQLSQLSADINLYRSMYDNSPIACERELTALEKKISTIEVSLKNLIALDKKMVYANEDKVGYIQTEIQKDDVKGLTNDDQQALRNYSSEIFFEINNVQYSIYRFLNTYKRDSKKRASFLDFFSRDTTAPIQVTFPGSKKNTTIVMTRSQLLEMLQSTMQRLDNLLGKSKLKESMMLFRGVSFPGIETGEKRGIISAEDKKRGIISAGNKTNEGMKKDIYSEKFDDEDYRKGLKNQLLRDTGYMSTSRKEAESIKFIAPVKQYMDLIIKNGYDKNKIQNSRVKSSGTLIRIAARKGAHAFDISGASDFESEAEVLFESGTNLIIRNAAWTEQEANLTEYAIDEYNKKYNTNIPYSFVGNFNFLAPTLYVETVV